MSASSPGGDTAMLLETTGDRIAKTQSAVVLEKMISQFMFGKAAEMPAVRRAPAHLPPFPLRRRCRASRRRAVTATAGRRLPNDPRFQAGPFHHGADPSGARLVRFWVLCCVLASPAHRAQVYDPLEPVNRADLPASTTRSTRWVLRPVATRCYVNVVPRLRAHRACRTCTRQHQRHVLSGGQQRVAGQARRCSATISAGCWSTRTFGIGGIFDIASARPASRRPSEDFGQTFGATGGSGPGPYLVLPILGPSNVRDTTVGLVIQTYIDPVNQVIRRTTTCGS